jgi:hypothetical protein
MRLDQSQSGVGPAVEQSASVSSSGSGSAYIDQPEVISSLCDLSIEEVSSVPVEDFGVTSSSNLLRVLNSVGI